SHGTTVDQACPASPAGNWTAQLASEDIAKRFKKGDLALLDLDAVSRTASGRVERMRLKWSDGSEQMVSGHEFRMAIGFDRLKSTKFDLAKHEGRGFEITGRGYGHGVGLCQWGARHLA